MTKAKRSKATAPIVLASARSIVRPRSATCGRACRSDPCTLRQLRYAERALDTEPVLVVWAELSVLAHLVGEAMPAPKVTLLDELARWSPRQRECAVSHAVDAAVSSRTTIFATQLSPDALAVHVNEAMNRWVISDESRCSQDGCRPWSAASDARPTRRLGHGADDPSRLENALGVGAGDAAWTHRLDRVLADFVSCRWPHHYLAAQDSDGGRG